MKRCGGLRKGPPDDVPALVALRDRPAIHCLTETPMFKITLRLDRKTQALLERISTMSADYISAAAAIEDAAKVVSVNAAAVITALNEAKTTISDLSAQVASAGAPDPSVVAALAAATASLNETAANLATAAPAAVVEAPAAEPDPAS